MKGTPDSSAAADTSVPARSTLATQDLNLRLLRDLRHSPAGLGCFFRKTQLLTGSADPRLAAGAAEFFQHEASFLQCHGDLSFFRRVLVARVGLDHETNRLGNFTELLCTLELLCGRCARRPCLTLIMKKVNSNAKCDSS